MRTARQLIDAPSTGTIYFDLRCSKSGYPFFTFLLLTSLFNLFLGTSVLGQSPGTVQSFQKISSSAGNFTGVLSNDDVFGHGLANIGDLNGDGVDDLAAGAQGTDDGGSNTGAVWILFMKSDGTVDFEQEISNSQGGFTGTLLSSANFGNDITAMGDIDGDGVPDIAVASAFDDDGGNNRGSVWILFMYSNGMVKSHVKITGGQGGFTGTVSNGDRFGSAISAIGDLNGDGFTDLAVGSQLDNAGGAGRGAVWILFLDGTGTVISHQKISDVDGGFTGVLDDNDRFAQVTAIGDLNGDNIMDIAVGASLDDDGGSNIGAIWILFLDTDGMVLGHQKISATQGNFGGVLAVDDRFSNPAGLGDVNGDGIPDIAVGTFYDDDGGTNRGAVWIIMLNADGTVKAEQKISSTEGNFGGALTDGDLFGLPVAALGDLNNDGVPDLAVAARQDDDGGTNKGALWILFLNGSDCQNFACGKNGQKVQMCHIPPGNSTNAHEICVSPNAVDAHLAHGDFCGPCSSSSKNDQSDLEKAELLVQRERVSIYPNPFTNSFFIELNQDMIIENEHIEVRIYDLFGRTVKTVNNLSTESLEIDLSGMCRGLYNYNILSDKGFVKTGIILKE